MAERLHNEATDHHGEVKAGSFYTHLLKEGKLPSDLEGYLKEYAGYVELLTTEFDHHAQNALIKNSDLLATIDFNDLKSFDETYAHVADQWADPRKDLPEGIFEFIVPGSHPFFTDVSTTYTGDNKAIEKFDHFGSHHVPYKTGLKSLFRKVEDVKTIEPLRLEEMRSLCKYYTEVTEKIKLTWRMQGQLLKEALAKVALFSYKRTNADPNVKHQVRRSYRYLNRAYGVSYEMGESLKFKTLHQFVKVSHALLTYMERSLNPSKMSESVKEPEYSSTYE